MKTIYLHSLAEQLPPCVATIGFFDGVHVGHRYLINKVIDTARRKGVNSAVITFANHPRQVLSTDWHPQLLSTLDEKMVLLSQTGIDQLVILQFDAQLASLSANEFMRDILHAKLNVYTLIMGYDNHFGHREANSVEDFEDYVRYGHELGMAVERGVPVDAVGLRVSSSAVRRLLDKGLVSEAASCLGRPYELVGKVVGGCHVGTGMGFPTANLQLNDVDKLIPAAGVYAVKVRLEDSLELKHGMMNIGNRPTFNGHHQTLETHIFRFEGNLYGQSMVVWFISRLRSEMRFDTPEALISQLEADRLKAEEILDQTSEK